MDFISRRVAIDQGHKLASNVKYLLAVQSGAIALAGIRTGGVRATNTDRTTKSATRKFISSAIRGALEQGLIKPVYGFYDEITAAGEEVYCSCDALPIYAPQKLPDEFFNGEGQT